jgi:hypothetical protein
MKKSMRALTATLLGSSLTLGSMAVMASPAAAASGKTDCGPVVQVVCTKTWDKATTEEFYDTYNKWWFPIVRKAATPLKYAVEELVGTELPKDQKERALDRMMEAVNDAYDHQGCLQAKWRKDKPQYPTEWTYVTGSKCR